MCISSVPMSTSVCKKKAAKVHLANLQVTNPWINVGFKNTCSAIHALNAMWELLTACMKKN